MTRQWLVPNGAPLQPAATPFPGAAKVKRKRRGPMTPEQKAAFNRERREAKQRHDAAVDSVIALDIPLRKRKPTTYFVNSMSDLFHERVPFEFVDRAFAVMALCSRHTFQVLTKRPKRMAEYTERTGKNLDFLERPARDMGWTLKFQGHGLVPWPLPNVWLGTSIENQETADQRIPHLLRTPAAIRFLSCEPLLSPLWVAGHFGEIEAPRGPNWPGDPPYKRDISWVIVGGESGRGARPCNVEWIRSIVRQCKAAGVPCFVKQLGAHVRGSIGDGTAEWPDAGFPGETKVESEIDLHIEPARRAGRFETRYVLAHPKGGDMSEWPADLRVREMPTPTTTPRRRKGGSHDSDQ